VPEYKPLNLFITGVFVMSQSQDSNEPKEERKLEQYHYEAMIRAEVEKRLAAEKKLETLSQPIYPPAYYESPPPPVVPQQQTGSFQPQQYYPNQAQPQQYQSGPLPYQQPYQQPQYYQQPPVAPIINVVVQNTNVNQNVNQGYYGRRYYRRQSNTGLANVVYFLLLGWMFGLSWGFVGLCVLPFNRSLSNTIFKQAVFLAILK
jgi:hypothetical protein